MSSTGVFSRAKDPPFHYGPAMNNVANYPDDAGFQ